MRYASTVCHRKVIMQLIASRACPELRAIDGAYGAGKFYELLNQRYESVDRHHMAHKIDLLPYAR